LIKIIKKNKRKKNKAGKHCRNPQYFMRKSKIAILNQLNIKNNKIEKNNFGKNYVGEHCSNPHSTVF
jgi:hypothetical protein